MELIIVYLLELFIFVFLEMKIDLFFLNLVSVKGYNFVKEL